MTKKTLSLNAVEDDAGKRLDVVLAGLLPDHSRSGIRHFIDDGLVRVGGNVIKKASTRLKGGEELEVEIPEDEPTEVEPEDIKLEILFEDKHLIVVNKPADMSVHPGAGNSRGTLAAALLAHCGKLSTVGGPLRPGIVHRLDKDTTGSIVAAKDDPTHHALSKQFSEHTTTRRYHALVWGNPKEDEGTIDFPLGRSSSDRKKIAIQAKNSKKATTNYSVKKRFGFVTLVEARPETGRTHQIRVHLTAINHPIVGDQSYGKRTPHAGVPKHVADAIKGIKSQCLHAFSLGFTHPSTGKYMEFKANYPADMARLLEILNKDAD